MTLGLAPQGFRLAQNAVRLAQNSPRSAHNLVLDRELPNLFNALDFYAANAGPVLGYVAERHT
jgi:hypothetical protein